MPGTNGLEHAVKMVDRLLSAGALEAQAHHSDVAVHEVNFSHERISLVRSIHNSQTQLAAYMGGKRGTSTANTRDEAEASIAVERACESARSSESDPGHATAQAESCPTIPKGDAQPNKDAMLELARNFSLDLQREFPAIRCDNCALSFSHGIVSLANSQGVRQQDNRGTHSVSMMFTAKEGPLTSSFYTHHQGSFSLPGRLLDLPHLRSRLSDAVAALRPYALNGTFTGDLIFTSESLPTLLGALNGALTGQSLLSGTTPYKDREGQPIASAHFTFVNAPGDPRFPYTCGFDGQGVPARTTIIVDRGILTNYFIDHYASRRLGRPQTAGLGNWIVRPGDTPMEDIVRGTKRGIILGRFSGGAPNSNLDFSGIAKNSLYVENGEILGPLGETMIAGNFQEILRNIRAVSSEVHNNGSHCLPAVASTGITITAGKA
ncbi:MAG: TldD/PmbA family protein [Planctomycetota bacterium]